MSENKVTENMAVSMEYTLTVNGEVLDSSEEHGPIEFLLGYQNIIPGLEKAVAGMAVGESKDVVVAAKDGYGESDSSEIKDVSKDEFPDEIPLKVGVDLEMKDDEGHLVHGTILEVGEESIKMDFNHPLAGKELHFAVKVVELRAATAEELSHGHIHSHGHGH
ncbi:MAG: peptidylprolyl isomerase [Chloroflexi bacterium]|nr:peptidylprolyl isomerase [Chloroflexota bacterium]